MKHHRFFVCLVMLALITTGIVEYVYRQKQEAAAIKTAIVKRDTVQLDTTKLFIDHSEIK